MKKKKYINRIIIAAFSVSLLLVLLRVFHVILHIGNSYKLCFSDTYIVDLSGTKQKQIVNDNNISEIKYMKQLKHFSAIDTGLTNIDFITEFPKLENLCFVGSSVDKENLVSIPSLKKLPNLDYVYLFTVDVNNLDFIADSSELCDLTVKPYNTQITDISALRNKPKLRYLILYNVKCDDFNVLLELDSLEYLSISGTKLPADIKEKLTEKGVNVKEKEVNINN